MFALAKAFQRDFALSLQIAAALTLALSLSQTADAQGGWSTEYGFKDGSRTTTTSSGTTSYRPGQTQDPKLLAKWAEYHLQRKEFDKAIPYLSKLIERFPTNSVYYAQRASLYQNSSQPDKALADYNKLVQLNPKNSDCYANRAVLLRDRGNHDAALKDIVKAIQLNQQNISYVAIRGEIYLKLYRYNEALADFNKCLTNPKLDPKTSSLIRFNRVEAFAGMKRNDDAISECDKLLPTAPEFLKFMTLQQRALANENKGDWQQAAEDYSKALALSFNPKKSDVQFVNASKGVFVAEAYLRRGMAYHFLKDDKQAQSNYLEAISFVDANRPKDVVYATRDKLIALFTTARANYLLGKFNESIAGFDEILGEVALRKLTEPDPSIIHYLRGNAYQRLGDTDRAEGDFKRAEDLKFDANETWKRFANAAPDVSGQSTEVESQAQGSAKPSTESGDSKPDVSKSDASETAKTEGVKSEAKNDDKK